MGAMTLSDLKSAPPVDRAFTPDKSQADHHAARLVRYRALYAALAPFAAA